MQFIVCPPPHPPKKNTKKTNQTTYMPPVPSPEPTLRSTVYCCNNDSHVCWEPVVCGLRLVYIFVRLNVLTNCLVDNVRSQLLPFSPPSLSLTSSKTLRHLQRGTPALRSGRTEKYGGGGEGLEKGILSRSFQRSPISFPLTCIPSLLLLTGFHTPPTLFHPSGLSCLTGPSSTGFGHFHSLQILKKPSSTSLGPFFGYLCTANAVSIAQLIPPRNPRMFP